MANRPPRQFPTPPLPVYPLSGADHNGMHSFANPYHSSNPHPPFGLPDPIPRTGDGPPPGTLHGGTLLHKGFYELLVLIPTPSPSRFLWSASADPAPEAVAGPRYEDIPGPNNPPLGNVAPPIANSPSFDSVSLKKGRRISADRVSKPMGFVYVCRSPRCASPSLSLNSTPTSYLVHASDADQAEALLTRWGPDGLDKLGSERLTYQKIFSIYFFAPFRSTLGIFP